MRAAIDDGGDVMGLADVDKTSIAVPTILRAPVVEDDLYGATIRYDEGESLA